MASNFQIQKPYVLATLPRPLGQASGRYVVGEVFGQQHGSRRKKRPELTVGIDGEAANIYDVASSRLVTSYPIPPQSSFTCPPCSERWRSSTSKAVARYTYISTTDPAPKITLFKDLLGTAGDTTSMTVSKKLSRGDKVVYLSTTSSATSSQPSSEEDKALGSDLVVVTEDGRIFCFNGEDLGEKWKTASDLLTRDLTADSRGSLTVEHVRLGPATDVLEGIFGGRQDVFSVFPNKVQEGAFNPDVLVLVTTVVNGDAQARHLHILAIAPPTDPGRGLRQSLIHLHTAPVTGGKLADNSSFRLDILSGVLLELRGDMLISHNLTSSVPRAEYKLRLQDITSALRISKNSVLTSTATSLDVYNPAFMSLQTSTPLDLSDTHQDSVARGELQSKCSLILYFARLQIAVGILGTSLIAVQLEAPKSRDRKRRAEGLLIDSIGRGISHSEHRDKRSKTDQSTLSLFSAYIPGSISKEYLEKWAADAAIADEALASGDLARFEKLLAEKFGLQVVDQQPLVNGIHGDGVESKSKQLEVDLPDWLWPTERRLYQRVDRRWVLYAISHVFTWQASGDGEINMCKLGCLLPDSHVLNYLVDAGHLTISNLKSAFRDQMQDVYDIDFILAKQLPEQLVEIDATMELLLVYLAGTKLGALELLTAIRLIMQSLELVQDPVNLASKLLTFEANGEAENEIGPRDEAAKTGDIVMELDRLEKELQVAENYLGDEGSVRARGLSVAFNKLSTCPPMATITALRRTLKPEEILSLIWLLRTELSKDGWTTRYLDTTRLDQDAELEPPPDGSIRLIAGLLCRCLDAVGPGGWLINDAILAAGEDEIDSADFLTSLKHQVSAALEGIQEAVFLRGLIGQVVKYANAVTKNDGLARRQPAGKPVVLRGDQADGQLLPLGLKPTRQRVSGEKVMGSGEVLQRSKREVGYLVSQKVEAYSVERIVL